MSSKLSSSNRYLRDPVLRERSVFKSVATSSAIEGIHEPFRQMSANGAQTGKIKASVTTRRHIKR